MRAHSAAPGSCGDFRGGLGNKGNGPSIAATGLPAHLIALLAEEGVYSLEDWRKLGRKRFSIFGVTTATAKRIDQAATEVRA